MKSNRRSWSEEKKVKKKGRLPQLNKRNRINRSVFPQSELKVIDEKVNPDGYGHLTF